MRSSQPINEHALTEERVKIRALKKELMRLARIYNPYLMTFQVKPKEKAEFIPGSNAFDIAEMLDELILTTNKNILEQSLLRIAARPNGDKLIDKLYDRSSSYRAEEIIDDIILHNKVSSIDLIRTTPDENKAIQEIEKQLHHLLSVKIAKSRKLSIPPKHGERLSEIALNEDRKILGMAILELSEHYGEEIKDHLIATLTDFAPNVETKEKIKTIFANASQQEDLLIRANQQHHKAFIDQTVTILKASQEKLVHHPAVKLFDRADNEIKQVFLLRAIHVLEKLSQTDINMDNLDRASFHIRAIIEQHKKYIDNSPKFFKPSYGKTHIALCNAFNALDDLQQTLYNKLSFKR